MTRFKIVTLIAMITLTRARASAEVIDLPDPSADLAAEVATVPSIAMTMGYEYAGPILIGAISRNSGGSLYVIKLQKAQSLVRLDLRVVSSKVKIIEVMLVTESGQRIEVQQLRNTPVLETGFLLNSENLNANQRIAGIEILAESFAAEADIVLTAIAENEVPQLFVYNNKNLEPAIPITEMMGRTTSPNTYVSNGYGGNASYGNRGNAGSPVVEKPLVSKHPVAYVGQKMRFGRKIVVIKAVYGYGLARISTGPLNGDVTVHIKDLQPL